MRGTSEGECVRHRVLAETGGALTGVRVVHVKRTDIRGGHNRTGVQFGSRGWSDWEEERNFPRKSHTKETFPGDTFADSPNNQGAAVAPIGSRWLTFGEWTPVRLSAGTRSPSCCAASLASSPGHLVKVFALIRVNLHYLSLTVAVTVGGDGVFKCIKFSFLTWLHLSSMGFYLVLIEK